MKRGTIEYWSTVPVPSLSWTARADSSLATALLVVPDSGAALARGGSDRTPCRTSRTTGRSTSGYCIGRTCTPSCPLPLPCCLRHPKPGRCRLSGALCTSRTRCDAPWPGWDLSLSLCVGPNAVARAAARQWGAARCRADTASHAGRPGPRHTPGMCVRKAGGGRSSTAVSSVDTEKGGSRPDCMWVPCSAPRTPRAAGSLLSWPCLVCLAAAGGVKWWTTVDCWKGKGKSE